MFLNPKAIYSDDQEGTIIQKSIFLKLMTEALHWNILYLLYCTFIIEFLQSSIEYRTRNWKCDLGKESDGLVTLTRQVLH